ncbi:phosphoribosylglycinamide formyltransferase [Flexithrix dorotheae]|uniref:phosphoribosylglycinamide formyltransferase n=1 Tax=Flexithrix dorotheae TaxID=70993 RepID=UPI00036E7FD1|nr:phosphoribosylglycinamide formyltransferase [Flexithrix dorotheae]
MFKRKIHIAIFASGTGSNAVKIIDFFKEEKNISFSVLSNKKDAPVLEKAQNLGVETFTFNRDEFFKQEEVLNYLKSKQTTLVVLAGFLWLVPSNIIKNFTNRIINIHPALLPKYGGKGMYGMKVHQAVVENKEKESGITIHYVDEQYDHGTVILQEKCIVEEKDTPEDVAQKIHQLEHYHYPRVVEAILNMM